MACKGSEGFNNWNLNLRTVPLHLKKSVVKDTTLILTVIAFNARPLDQFYWTHNNHAVKSGGRVTVNENTLSIRGVKKTDNGDWVCNLYRRGAPFGKAIQHVEISDKCCSWIDWLLSLAFLIGIILITAIIVLAICLGCKLNKIHQMSQRYSNLQAIHSQLDKDYKNLQANYSQLDKDYKNLLSNLRQLDKDYKNLQANCSQLDKDYKNLQANCSQLDKDYKNLQANCSQLDKAYKNLQANCSQLDKDYKNLQANHSQLDKDYKNLQANHSQLDKDYENLQANSSQLDKDYKNLQANYSQLDEEYNQLWANFNQLHLTHNQTLVGVRRLLNTVIDNECNITCPNGWVEFNKTCYYFSTSQADWFKAKNSCSLDNATLAIVKTQGQQDFIANNDYKKRWIGLTDLEVVKHFRWVNGDLLETEFWDTGEPNNVGQERCVTKGSRFHPNKWNNDICKTHHYWICGITHFDYLAWQFGLETVLD